jgi:hypothetical protein
MTFRSPNTAILPRYAGIIGDERSERGSGKVQRHVYPANGRRAPYVASPQGAK